jgi:hypothetical protein
MPSTKVGEERVSGLLRLVGAIIYFLVIGWVIGLAVSVLVGLYGLVDLLWRILLNRTLEWGEAWPKAAFVWQIYLLKWMAFGEDFPGWYPTPRQHA